MLLADFNDTPYKIMLLLHIVAVLAAFAPVFIHPFLAAEASPTDNALFRIMHRNGRRVHAPALLLAGLLGFGLVGMSDDRFSLGDGWILTSILLWVAANGLVHALILPGERAAAEGDADGARRAQAGGAAVSLVLVVLLILMVWGPR